MNTVAIAFAALLMVASLVAWRDVAAYQWRQSFGGAWLTDLLEQLRDTPQVSVARRTRRLLLLTGSVGAWMVLPLLIHGLLGAPRAGTLGSVLVTAVAGGVVLLFAGVLWRSIAGCEPAASLEDLRHADGLDVEGWQLQLRAGCRAFLLSLLPVAAMQGVLSVTGLRQPDEISHSVLELLQQDSRPGTVVLVVLAVVVVAPVVEEWVFRVALQGFLRTIVPVPAAIAVAAVLFAGVHAWPNPLPLFPLAVILGIVFHRQRSMLAVVVAHSLFNLANVVLFLLSE